MPALLTKTKARLQTSAKVTSLFLFFLFFSGCIASQVYAQVPAAPLMSCVGAPGNTVASSGTQCKTSSNVVYLCTNSSGCTVSTDWVAVGSATVVHSFGATFDGGGSPLAAGKTVYFTVPYVCAINAYNLVVDTGTATVDIWKIASGTAIPTISNTITASATPAISTGTALHSAALPGWLTSVAANDIVGINLKVVSGATFVNLQVQCQ